MNTFKAQMAIDAGSVVYNTAEFGDSITYTPKGGAGKAITAIVDIGTDVADNGYGTLPAVTGRAAVQVSDVAAPAPHDSLLIAGATWYVVRILSGDSAEWVLEIVTEERVRQ